MEKRKRIVSTETRAKISASQKENWRRWREVRSAKASRQARAMFIATQAGEMALRERIPFAEAMKKVEASVNEQFGELT